MKRFVKLFHDLGNTSSITKKIELMASYFSSSSGRDRDLSLYILSGGNIKRQVTSTELRRWATEFSSIPGWLFEESYHVVGDLAETISLLCKSSTEEDTGTLEDWIKLLEALKGKPEEERKQAIFESWNILSQQGCIVFNKLMTAGLRIGVSKGMVIKALSKATGIEEPLVAQRLAGVLTIEHASYERVVMGGGDVLSLSPYPFFLAYAVEDGPQSLGEPEDWVAEWKWDGIRGQIVRRGPNGFAVWSRGEELLTDNFPEFTSLIEKLKPGTVLDGEIIGWSNGKPLSFAALQKRITRKKVTPKVMEECPIVFLSYDLLEIDGDDIRTLPLEARRAKLQEVIETADAEPLLLSTPIQFSQWEDLIELRKSSRAQKAEGVMLKRKTSTYQTGRRRGDWWKWKIDPLSIDGVLIYAQKGHGRRADLYTDYTFGVWDNGTLVPITKAYSGLTDKEFQKVDAFIKKNTIERFGPVRTVKAELVFEIAFEGIQASSRHKSGIAFRFPRMARWRQDKPSEEADTLDNVRAILKAYDGE